ncbi:MAG: hypothetical protein ACUVUD_05220 [bacterium]
MPPVMMAVGGFGLAAQVVIVRELFAAFAGNEVSSGIFLSLWLLGEGFGAWLLGRKVVRWVRARWTLTLLGSLSVLSSIAAVALVVYSRRLLGLLPGENLGLGALFLVTLVVVLLPAGTHGALFVLGATLSGGRKPVARVYFYEGLGTALAAVVCYFGLLSRVPNLGIVALMGGVLLLTVGVVNYLEQRALSEGAISFLLVAVTLYVLMQGGKVERWLWGHTWQGQELLGLRDSPYGKLMSLEREGQRQVLYDGTVTLVTPNPNPGEIEELAHVPLLLARAPERVLVFGAGLGGLINEILKWPVRDVRLVLLDRWVVDELRRTGGRMVAEELSDRRVKVVIDDPRRFLETTSDSFDCVIITNVAPDNLSTNRLFTKDFFKLCRRRLKANGILATPIPGVPGAMSPEALAVAETRWSTLSSVFRNADLILLDFPLFVAGEQGLIPVDSLVGRWERMGIETRVLTLSYFVNLLDPFRQDFLRPKFKFVPLNTDFVPRELFLNMVLEHRRSSPWFSRFYRSLPIVLSRFLLPAGVILLLVVASGAVLWEKKTHRLDLTRGFGIFTSGFAGAGISILSIFVYSSRFGSIYNGVALLFASFIFGTVLGGGVVNWWRPRRPATVFALGDIVLLTGSGAILLLAQAGGQIVFVFLLMATGVCLGGQFALTGQELMMLDVPRLAGYLSVLDWTGGALGGVVMAVVVLPIWGISGAIGLIVLIKLTSAVIQLLTMG